MKTRRTTLRFRLFSFAGVFLAAALAIAVPAIAKDPAAKAGAQEAALRAAEIRRFEANVNADAKVLGELLDDGLEYVHSNGELDTKKSFIDSLTSGSRDYASTAPHIDTIRIHGDVAIIRGTAKVTVIDHGNTRQLDIGYTDVWLWKDHRWQMTAWRSARLPDAPAK